MRIQSIATPVDDYASSIVKTVESSTSLAEIVDILHKESFRHIPVVSEGKPIGVVSDRDVKIFVSIGNMDAFEAKDIMTPAPYTVLTGTSLKKVVTDMIELHYGSAVIVNKRGALCGIYTTTDALKTISRMLDDE